MELPRPWARYAQIQDQLARHNDVDDLAWGLEAALDRLSDGEPAEKADRYASSAARRERYRARLRRRYLGHPTPTDPTPAIIARETLGLIMAMLQPADWAILVKLAEGHEYSELGDPGALRTRVCRIRRSLRNAGIGQAFRGPDRSAA